MLSSEEEVTEEADEESKEGKSRKRLRKSSWIENSKNTRLSMELILIP